jgi:multidrug efflux pump subunit AcrB
MNLAQLAIEKRAVTYFVAFLLLTGGVSSFFQLGQLEDPDFTVKTGMVFTQYPGASPEEVELEVTDLVESAIQELPQLDSLYSESRAGLSLITVDIKQEYWADRLPQVWDELRKKVRDIHSELPPGAENPVVMDDFSFVYGFVLAVTGDGFTPEELYEYAKSLRKDLSLVSGVSRAEYWGEPAKVIYVDAPQSQLAALGLSAENVAATLRQQNMVVDAGWMDVGGLRFRVAPTGSFQTPEDIGRLEIRGTTLEALATVLVAPGAGDASASMMSTLERTAASTESLIRIEDIGTVREGLLEPPPWEMRWDGDYAIGISLANVAGGNIVDTGRGLDRRLEELIQDLPVGIEVHKVSWQSDLVTDAINAFMVNLAEAVAIVLVVLALAMGWRMGVIIGTALIQTILGTFILMAIFGIDLQRMSLGALVIALGMMVDNAIVVSDGIYSALQRGRDAREASIEVVGKNSGPLLFATLVAVMACYPIFASQADAGEYCRTLFTVVAISLLLSWLVAMTLTPIQCIDMLKVEPAKEGEDPYDTGMYRWFRWQLERAIRARFFFVGAMVGLLALAVVGFGGVRQMFSPTPRAPRSWSTTGRLRRPGSRRFPSSCGRSRRGSWRARTSRTSLSSWARGRPASTCR